MRHSWLQQAYGVESKMTPADKLLALAERMERRPIKEALTNNPLSSAPLIRYRIRKILEQVKCIGGGEDA